MEVIRAKSAGFCFGVKRAVDTVYEQVKKQMGKQIYTYGPIIHNEEVVKDMEAHGVKVLRSEEELKGLEEGLVIIRSHGVPKRICDLMDEKGSIKLLPKKVKKAAGSSSLVIRITPRLKESGAGQKEM